MPLSIATIQSQVRETDLKYLGENVHLTYRPGQITPESGQLPMAEWIPAVVVSWDFLDFDGATPYPLDADRLRALPDPFLRAVTDHLVEDSRLDPSMRSVSGGG